ncbi:thiamine biosynthesis protein ThiI [Paenisporosarcina quisquiliarum]|uniref:tRNA uracil 4-sulfurtransferase ThiI n=1 Tax=Psychrobacillus TaxID=1221880 RepID=UPI0008ACC8DA|nr:tRNA uracil 4-sulfurtransferase ThiI [Psychrobacillus psychrodurans]MCK1996700.1 tRNA 4-thiouridine(8) synthase ThiI [Psychrobacillus psychrodurans]MCZ8541803.1 tRNA 4-thiouridine(8) synthase ThiI [Psychrobacillus psychrodurans]SEM56574.1 thiamine biosynthesis protein ThiI [Paenisporosarcina quisquiliarum]SFN01773.1 thiamine biosynthesis protein ThiI [Psychrobacillus psychrodurans]
MKWEKILVRYGELSTKGKNRKQFISHLRNNIRFSFVDLPNIKIQAERDRMFLTSSDDSEIHALIERLPKIFGIQSFSPVASCSKDLDDIQATALKIMDSLESQDKTFRVTVKRTDKFFPLDTYELQSVVASNVLRQNPTLKVQMKKPEIDLRIEVLNDAVYMMAQVIPGAGGMPLGSNGRSLLMLSGGIDSPVAGYMLLKRGVRLDAIHFHSPPFTSERSKEKVMDLANQLSHFGATVRLHVIPFTDIQQSIQAQIPENVSMTTTRRLMMKIADLVRAEIGALGIVTGESLGQVASQTLESLTAINAVTSTPIFRPLISMDKLDIIDIAREIGTYETSILPYEDCCTIFTPSCPKTKPKLEKVEYYESFKDFDELITEAVQNREVLSFPMRKSNEFSSLL